MVLEKSLRRWTNAELERVRKVEMIAWVFGLWWSCGSGFVARWWSRFRAGEAVALWSVPGAERAAEGAASGSCYPREFRTGIREVRDSTIDALEQAAGRALRDFAALVPARGRVWNLAR